VKERGGATKGLLLPKSELVFWANGSQKQIFYKEEGNGKRLKLRYGPYLGFRLKACRLLLWEASKGRSLTYGEGMGEAQGGQTKSDYQNQKRVYTAQDWGKKRKMLYTRKARGGGY